MKLRLGLSLILLGLCFSIKGMAHLEKVSKGQLRSCGPSFCAHLHWAEATRSPLDRIYVFGKAQLSVHPREGGVTSITPLGTYQAEDGYYDPDLGRVILRGVQGQKFKELVFDLKSGGSTYF